MTTIVVTVKQCVSWLFVWHPILWVHSDHLKPPFSTFTKLKFGRAPMNRIQNHEGGISDVYDLHDYADQNRQIMQTVGTMVLIEGRRKCSDDGAVVPR